jgi:hypothetical protein
LAPRHYFSSSSSASPGDGDDANSTTVVSLYERNPDRNRIPQAAFLGVSLVNTMYWLWYALDFIPAVNASPSPELHIDPAVGAAGVALGALINSVIILYPAMTISKVTYQPSTQAFQLYKHSLLPLIRPSIRTPITSPLGSITMDRTSSDTTRILDEL